MRYSKPPVVEVALTFNFKPSSKTPNWDEASGTDFIGGIVGFKKQRQILDQNIQIISNIKTGATYTNTPQHTIREINASICGETEILGVGKNYLTYHKIRRSDDYPHYTPVAEKIFEYLPQYRNFWKPEKIQNVVLSYVDIVVIPETEPDLDTYFNVGVKFPRGLGKIDQFETHLVFPPQGECNAGLDLHFSKVSYSDSQKSCFHLFWNCFKNVCDESHLKQEVEEAHQYASIFFEEGVTDKCKNLFEPQK
jgi:uncharacterized protein (TIGR04255 family)